MATPFSPASVLERHIYAGDFEGTLACASTLSATDRSAHQPRLRLMLRLCNDARWTLRGAIEAWGGSATEAQLRSIGAAILLCGPLDVLADAHPREDDLLRIARDFGMPSPQAVADVLLKRSPHYVRSAQVLIEAGLIQRPQGDEYVHGLIALPRFMRSGSDFARLLAADPGLAQALLRVFEVEGTAEDSLASLEKYNHNPETSWTQIFLNLVRAGIYSRAMLLERTLSALARDWPQHRSGWFSRFHDALQPSAAEMHPLTPRYLALSRSRIAPTVTLALAALKTLQGADLLDGQTLLPALKPVTSSGIKSQVEAATRLLDAIVRCEPALAQQSAAVLCPGLLHESAQLQKQILERLAAWGLPEESRGTLRSFLSGVAAINRPRLLQLIGDTPAPADDRNPPAQDLSPTQVLGSVLDLGRQLKPVAGIDELVETIAHVFENDTDINEFERAVEALVRLAPDLDGARARLGPVLKRARRAKKPLALELARLLIFAAEGERLGSRPTEDHGGNRSPLHGLLIRRIDALMDNLARLSHLSPLSSPTHQRGFIDPQVFVQRVADHLRQALPMPLIEQVQGLLRLAPSADGLALEQARHLPDAPLSRALRYALGDACAPEGEQELLLAAARIRCPDADVPELPAVSIDCEPDGKCAARYQWSVASQTWTREDKVSISYSFIVDSGSAPRGCPEERIAVLRHPPGGANARDHYRWWSFAGIDEAMVHYSATVLPGNLEAFFAEGARALGNNLDWWEAQWQNRAYLQPLLDPTVAMTPMATLALALGLAGTEPGQTALATDALVRTLSDRRLDATTLGTVIGKLLATPMIKAARYRKSLQQSLQMAPQLADAVFDLLCTALCPQTSPLPKEVAELLELLLELMIDRHRSLPPAIRETLASLRLGGKGKPVQRELLSRHAAMEAAAAI